ncbi:hypothetical protein ACXWRS_10765, partial [Streptococcus pyogenes]
TMLIPSSAAIIGILQGLFSGGLFPFPFSLPLFFFSPLFPFLPSFFSSLFSPLSSPLFSSSPFFFPFLFPLLFLLLLFPFPSFLF